MKKYLCFSFIFLLMCACNPVEQMHSAEITVEEAIQFYGGKSYDSIDVSFQFRDKLFTIYQVAGNYQYTRQFVDSANNKITDILSNQGLSRLRNGELVDLSSKDSAAYASSVNSVIYFAMLPKKLENPAVNLKSLHRSLINGEVYLPVQVTFKKEGGGVDYDDQFLFWFHAQHKTMDYFAYAYATEGGGVRFREVIDTTRVNGILFQDYNNYEAAVGTPLSRLPEMFKNDSLRLLSKIKLEFD